MASVSNINVNKFEMKKTGNNVAGEIYGTESENETFSSVFPGSNERLVYLNFVEKSDRKRSYTSLEDLFA